MKNIFYFLFILLSTNSIIGQIVTFNPEPEKFLKDVQSHLATFDKADAKKFVSDFEPVWLGDFFNPDIKAHVYSTVNLMAQKGLKPYPDFKNYFTAIYSYAKSGKTPKDFDDWQITLDKVLNGRNKKKMSDYIKTSNYLFSKKSIYIASFNPGSTVWKISNDNFTFSYDKFPIIHFKNTDLKCFSKNDSSVIYNTNGDFYPLTSNWVGNGGKVTWERVKFDKEKVFAVINNYSISLKRAGFSADSVLFTSKYFSRPIKGKLTEKVLSNLGVDKAKYPNFESFEKRLHIDNFFPSIDYEGGFSIRGKNLFGSGSLDTLAKVTFKYNGEDFLTAEAFSFIINEDEIFSQKTRVRFKIDEDSITHPAVNLNYSNKIKKVTLSTGQDGVSAAPFYNSYHKLDMYIQALYWKVGDPIIDLGSVFGSTDISAHFDSQNFFDIKLYDYFLKSGSNPLIDIRNFCDQYGGTTFPISNLSLFLRKPIQDLEFILFELTELGFISYSSERKIITVSDKLFNYIEARSGKMDYDVIVINSNDKTNAKLSLSSNDLTLYGVERVLLSKAQKVWFKPSNQELLVKKNREFEFDGLITAGKTQYYGNGFGFLYDEFELHLGTCDSMFIWPDYLESNKAGQLIRSLSVIENIKGVIQIDSSNNKAGIDTSLHDFPKLTCNVDSYVYYDDKSILNGVYARDSFKFVIHPFVMDSLDNYTNQGLLFSGDFISGGIFPKFSDNLRLQEDYSLGFIRKTPSEGFNLYGHMANYDNDIRLSHKGLQGSGTIEFFTSKAISNELTFFPDSVTAIAQSYVNEKREGDPELPYVIGVDCKVSYIPNEELLYASSIEDNLMFFDSAEANLNGTLSLSKSGMTGAGVMRFGKGEVKSYEYTYEANAINADTAEFKLISNDAELDELAFKTQNVNARVDFETRKGEFKSNSGESFVSFPDNQYICYMDQFNWYMDNDDLEMENSKRGDINIETDLNLAKSNFYSVHPDQDSLNFSSPKAKFDVKKNKITCNKIEYIKIADSRIVPDSGQIIIRKKARIETLNNAKIITNDVTKYHEIYKAKVDINARNEYIGSGTYDYIDENEQKQEIYFSYIKPDTTNQSVATGSISEKKKFKLSPSFKYKGDVKLSSNLENLEFSGSVKIVHSCKNNIKEWMPFVASINPKEIYIPIDTSLDSELISGIILNTTDSLSLYSSFMSKISSNDHLQLITASGYLYYDKSSKEYRISNKDKLNEYTLPGNYVSLKTDNCRLKADGKFDFGIDLDQVSLKPTGEIKFNPKKWSTDIKSSTMLNFPISEPALDNMAKSIIEYPDLRVLDVSNSYYEKSLRELFGIDRADEMVSEITINNKIKKLPEDLKIPIFFGDIRFRWNANRKAYVSYGDIGIANIFNKQIMKYVKGKVVISKKLTGNDITVYLQLDDKTYYYFNYKRGLMQVFSSNEEFNTIITETKKDDTKFKGTKEQVEYQYMLGTEKLVTSFKSAFMQ
ncbi:MAG: hypothetical protein CL846_05620 [Crocinitomicaceae bacterium]|nr:hypothetical protein [Crocinitomicaceae bacterium]|tara:strand:- start:873 stop:5300 length:4428 start_codon:yes stop_codon:yes gene_type:complete